MISLLLFAAGANAVTLRAVTAREAEPKFWSASARYYSVSPGSNGSRTIANLANAALAAGETKAMADWIKEARRERDIRPWEYLAETQLRLNNEKLLSFRTMTYVYQGGAHGMTYWRHYNFGWAQGKLRRFGVWDALKSDAQARRDFKMMLLGKAMVAPGADWVDEGTVTDFTDLQLARFWVNGEGLCWDFEPYALGSYAAGTITLRASYSELKKFIRPGGPIDVYLRKR